MILILFLIFQNSHAQIEQIFNTEGKLTMLDMQIKQIDDVIRIHEDRVDFLKHAYDLTLTRKSEIKASLELIASLKIKREMIIRKIKKIVNKIPERFYTRIILATHLNGKYGIETFKEYKLLDAEDDLKLYVSPTI